MQTDRQKSFWTKPLRSQSSVNIRIKLKHNIMQILISSKSFFKTTITTTIGLAIGIDGYEDTLIKESRTLL